MRVLLVEDEARLVGLLRATLVDAGFVVDAMTSAGDARAALAVGVYDVVILDLGLPDGDGLDVLASARRGGKNMPILVLTARDAVEDRVRGLDAGADDYLVKPLRRPNWLPEPRPCCAGLVMRSERLWRLATSFSTQSDVTSGFMARRLRWHAKNYRCSNI